MKIYSIVDLSPQIGESLYHIKAAMAFKYKDKKLVDAILEADLIIKDNYFEAEFKEPIEVDELPEGFHGSVGSI